MKTTNMIQRLCLFLFALALVAPAWAEDVTLQDDNGTKYVNMPHKGTNTLTLDGRVTSFKVYDNGGKDGNYSDNSNGTLVLTAPEGYIIKLSGSIKTEEEYDNLTVYDSKNIDGTKLLATLSSSRSGVQTAIPNISSTGQGMTLKFQSDGSNNYAGLDLTVEVVKLLTFTPTLSFDTQTQKAWALTPPAITLPSDYTGKPTYSSNNEEAVKVDDEGRLMPGGNSCFGQTATIDINYPATAYYKAATASYTITVEADKTMPLASPADWQKFCDLVNGGQNDIDAKLTQDIDLGTELSMVGTETNMYSGTFDGQGHSITVNWNTAQMGIAPFRNINGATIKNVYTQGDITTSDKYGYISGMVWSAAGHVKLTNCSSMVNLTATGSQAYSAGMIGYTENNSYSELTDCLVGGKFSGNTSNLYGFIRYRVGWCVLKNCLYIGENPEGTTGYTFVMDGKGVIDNCYYLYPCGTAQGEQVTEEQLRNGDVAHKLQNGRSETVWGQKLGTDYDPLLTADTKKRVHRVEFRYNDKVWATHYVNNGKTVTPPTVQDIVGNSYDPHHYYAFNFSENITSSTPINADKTVTITLTEHDHFAIASPADWQKFCEVVNGEQNAVDAKLTEDINLGTELSMVGTETNMYSGTFDGQGHSITVNWNTAQKEIALFRNINGATIKNLHTKGSITTSNDIGEISGMVWQANGHVTLTACSSMVNLTATGIQANSAGMIGYTEHSSYSELTDCLVGGKFSGSIKYWYGFVQYQGGWCVLKNCLYIGENPEGTTGYTFVMDGMGHLENCYYLNPCGKAQGEQTDEEDLKTGKLLAKLGSAWAQKLGEMPELYSESKKNEDNYLYYDTENSAWTCDNFSLAKHPKMPIGIDFTAARIKDSRTFAETDKTCTMCLPYDFPINGFKAYTLSGNTGTTLRFKEVEGKLEAYHPYYIVLNGLQSTDGENLLVKAYNDEALEKHEGDCTFRGTMFKIDNMSAAFDDAYILQDDNLWHKVMAGNAAVNIPAYRAYIMPKLQVWAKTLSISFDDETTGISAIETTDLDGTVRYYDLSGRYIGTSLKGQPKGIYVGNGKKVIH